ncbi:MAG: pitrilysin family protein [Acidobacteriota bacterium]
MSSPSSRAPVDFGVDPARLFPQPELHHFDNGLTVALLVNRQAPIVSSALWLRCGSWDDPPGQGGIAHFLEHMMFKGSASYGPGEVDRLTRMWGGSNNAFTSHLATVYTFTFARHCWRIALDLERDRIAALNLDPVEVASERQVILEELAMYEADPWDALDQAVASTLWGAHPFGRPVIGTRAELVDTDAPELRAFHQTWHQPANAVLVLAGDLEADAVDFVAERFADLPGSLASHPEASAPPTLDFTRHERHTGDVTRMLWAFRAPAANHPDHTRLRLLLGVLTAGRTSRLSRRLVDEGQLCTWVASDLSESRDASQATLNAELVPGVEPEQVEAVIRATLDELRTTPPEAAELARVRHLLLSDRIFGLERIHQQAMAIGGALALFDLDHPRRQLEAMLTTSADALPAVAGRWLDPEAGSVLGWSLP